MIDAGGVDAKFEVGGCIRTLSVEPGWDMEPWQSDSWNPVRVSGVIKGRSREWTHSATATHGGHTLPDSPPEPVAFDFEALVRRAVVQTGAPTPRRS